MNVLRMTPLAGCIVLAFTLTPDSVVAEQANADEQARLEISYSTTALTTATLQPNFLNFGCIFLVGLNHLVCTPPRAVTLTNTGKAVLHIYKITAGGVFSYFNGNPGCGSTLFPGKSCVLVVRFTRPQTYQRTRFLGALDVYDNTLGGVQKVTLLAQVP